MRVRRKSEIAEAVQRANGWSIFYPTDTHFVSNETFAAHYEPVPEPPAARELAIWIANACLNKEGCDWDNVMDEKELDELVTQPIIKFAESLRGENK